MLGPRDRMVDREQILYFGIHIDHVLPIQQRDGPCDVFLREGQMSFELEGGGGFSDSFKLLLARLAVEGDAGCRFLIRRRPESVEAEKMTDGSRERGGRRTMRFQRPIRIPVGTELFGVIA